MRTTTTYNDSSPRVHAVLMINLRQRVAKFSNADGRRLPEGTTVEILDGDDWLLGRVDSSGVVAILQDQRFPNSIGWQVPLAMDEDDSGLGRKWRYAG